MSKTFNYGTDHLSIGICLDIASGKVKGVIAEHAKKKIVASWNEVKKIVEREIPVYGINTGFGPLCDTHISEEDTTTLQYNLLKSHSVGEHAGAHYLAYRQRYYPGCTGERLGRSFR